MHPFAKSNSNILAAFLLLIVLFSGCKKEEGKNFTMNQLGGANLKGLANSPVGTPRAVEIRDEEGLPEAGFEVTFTIVSGGGSVDNAVVKTDADGVAAVNWTLGSSGAQTLKVEAKTSKNNLIDGAPVTFESGIVAEGTFTDPRDGQVYKTLSIGGQTWFAQNLRYNAIGSRASGFNTSYNVNYGRYYNWYVAQTACPQGWHLPTNDEWYTLEINLGIRVNSVFGDIISHYPKHMKSVSMWESSDPGSAGTNALGFDIYPAGYVSTAGGDAVNNGYNAYIWTSTSYDADSTEAWNRNYSYDSYGIGDSPYWDKLEYASSCRCVQD